MAGECIDGHCGRVNAPDLATQNFSSYWSFKVAGVLACGGCTSVTVPPRRQAEDLLSSSRGVERERPRAGAGDQAVSDTLIERPIVGE